MPKSGTSTFHEAKLALGYRARHNPDDGITKQQIRDGDYKLKVLSRFDVLSDTPVPAIFPQLDQNWPDSKFVLTIRNEDQWIASSRKAGFNQSYARPKKGSKVDFYNSVLFGCSTFNEDRYPWVFRNHNETVMRYFSGEKSRQLITIDFTAGDGWEALCPFLEQSVPDRPFPHANSITDRRHLSPLMQRLVGVAVKVGFD